METRANYVLIGAFVLVMAAALMMFTVLISGTSFRRAMTTYDVVFEGPVNGLSEGGEVRFNGIKVGEVSRLSLDRQDPNRVIARIRVDAQTPVRTDSVAQLDFLGITGVTFIQIRAGTATEALLKPEDFGDIPIIRTERTALDELFSGGQDFLSVSSDTINRVNEALSDENIALITGVLANLNTASSKVAADGGLVDSATSALKSIDRAAATLDRVGRNAERLIDDVDGDVRTLVSETSAAMAELRPALRDARSAIAGINEMVANVNSDLAPGAGAALDQFSSATSELRALLMRLQVLTGELEQDPSRFVYRRPQPVE